jgi:hypothetical protein
VSSRFSAPCRIATVVVVLGLLGSAIVTVSLSDAPAKPAGRRTAGGKLADRPGGGDLIPGAPRSGRGRAAAPAASAGLRLLRQAATACQQVSYHGVQLVAWWGSDGSATSTVDVWHQPGHGTLAEPAGAPASAPDRQAAPLATPGSNADGSLDLSGVLLDLMQANYEVRYTGDGDADDRPAHIVEVRRPGGSLAARFWLDAATSLPLRRDMFDASARKVSEDAFVSLSVGAAGLAAMPATAASPWSGRLTNSQLAALRDQSWPLPAGLPGLTLFAAQETTGSAQPVVDMSYSDGLAVVSVFVQHGTLPGSMTGWREEKVAGHLVWASGSGLRSLTWSAQGFEFTLIASAPPATVSQVVAALPRAPSTGFWPRLKRGFHRMGSWANPFR